MTAAISLDGGTMRIPGGVDVDPVGLAGRIPQESAVRIRTARRGDLSAYRQLRRLVFCQEQGLFSADDSDFGDLDDRSVVLVAVDADEEVIGGVRVSPHAAARAGEWWVGSRLAVAPGHRGTRRIGASLVGAACSYVAGAGALRFDAAVQAQAEGFFAGLGWESVTPTEMLGRPHVMMRWPINRLQRVAEVTKGSLGPLLAGLEPGGAGFVGDDGAPVPGSDLVAVMDAIVPAMVERDPEWAGWCSVLVNINDLSAMGATPVALLDSLGGVDLAGAAAVMSGIRRAAAAWGVPLIGGHTQIGVPPMVAVTAIGSTARPVRAGGGRPGHEVRVTADVTGGWRPGYRGGQWDSTSTRSPQDLDHLARWVGRSSPAAAKDVSMAGLVGTLGMLAEASGCGAELDLGDVPAPAEALLADWLTCFPGWAMITAAPAGTPIPPLPDGAVSAVCGRLIPGSGVDLRWADGQVTKGIAGAVSGLGPAFPSGSKPTRAGSGTDGRR